MTQSLSTIEVVKADVCTHIFLDDCALHAAGGLIKKPDPLKLPEAVSVFKGAGLKILLQVGANKFPSKGTQPTQFYELAAENHSRVQYVMKTLEIEKKTGPSRC
jgi:hypothetical protein